MNGESVHYTTAGDYWNRGKLARAIVVARALFEAHIWNGQADIWIHEPMAVFNRIASINPVPVTELVAGVEYEIRQSTNRAAVKCS